MTTEINERYIKLETNGNLPEELTQQLFLMVKELVTKHPSFFEGEPQVNGRIFAFSDAMFRVPDDGALVRIRRPVLGGSGRPKP